MSAGGRLPASLRVRTACVIATGCLSGMAGLGYEMVWTRMLAVSLGHELVAVLSVLAAFFVGLSLGAFLLGRRIRITPQPHRWYAALELVIGAWALSLIALTPRFHALMPRLLGANPSAPWHWALAFFGTFLLLSPATFAMGATLPALERAFARGGGGNRWVAGLYAANTAGAVVGTLLATFWLAPSLGYANTLWILAGLNALSAALVWVALRPVATADAQSERVSRASNLTESRPVLGVLFASGLLGVGYEVLVVRVLSQVLANTVYTFAALLAVYLLGTALGAGLWQRWASASARRAPAEAHEPTLSDRTLSRLLTATAVACLMGVICLWASPFVLRALRAALGAGMAQALSSELAVAFFALLVPSACMGALFSHLAQRASLHTGLGAAMSVNTLGSALAPPLFGVLLLPALGAKTVLVALAVAYLFLTPERTFRTVVFPSALALAVWLSPLSLRFVTPEPGGKILAYREGVMATVAVVSDGSGERYLKVNGNLTMGGTASAFSDHRQTHIPLLLHPAPQRALFLGVGTGITFDAAKEHPNLAATGVELIPEVLSLLPQFGTSPDSGRFRTPPVLRSGDARRFVLSTEASYDVVIAELFHPWTDGAAALYTAEHFASVRDRLAPGGLFCQWLPLYQLDLPTLKLIVRTFLAAFPHVHAHLGHFSLEQPILGLIGTTDAAPTYAPDYLEQRVRDPQLQRKLVELRLNSDFALYGGFVAEEQGLASFAGSGPLNTDDRPRVAFAAPSAAYAAQDPPAQRLLSLIGATRDARARMFDLRRSPGPDRFETRLAQYWVARDAYLRAGVHVQPTEDLAQMLAQTKQPLLDVVRLSPDFVPAYTPLLGMARGLYSQNPGAAHALLTDLAEANPERPEAAALRQRLFGR